MSVLAVWTMEKIGAQCRCTTGSEARNFGKVAPVAEITGWQGRMTPRDYAALTPLVWEHVNPYGRFDLDMDSQLALL